MVQPRVDVMGETVPCLSLVLVLVSRRLEDTFVVLVLRPVAMVSFFWKKVLFTSLLSSQRLSLGSWSEPQNCIIYFILTINTVYES